jgi:hypothetical protein
MCKEMQWKMNPVLNADTDPYLVDIGTILILLKGFSYQNLRGKLIIAPGSTVFKLLNEMQMTLTQQLLCAFFLMANT